MNPEFLVPCHWSKDTRRVILDLDPGVVFTPRPRTSLYLGGGGR